MPFVRAVQQGSHGAGARCSPWRPTVPAASPTVEFEAVGRILPALERCRLSDRPVARRGRDPGAYLGPQTGAHVLQGMIRRGDSQVISAALLLADLRGFTALVDGSRARKSSAGSISISNASATRSRSMAAEVLKFLGDGLLAVFPSERIGAERGMSRGTESRCRCRRPERGAQRPARDRGRARAGPQHALHFGDVIYGNIGTARRLDFTAWSARPSTR